MLRVIGKGGGGRITVLVGRCLHVPCVILVTATKFAKIMFLHLSVSHSVHWGRGGGGSASRRVCIWGVCIHGGSGSASCGGGGEVGQTSLPQIPRDTVNERAVRILLECILV